MSDLADTPPLEVVGTWPALVKSFANLAAGEVVARMLGLAAVVVMARRLDPGGFGLITLGATLVTWFALVADWGTEVLNIRDVARAPGRFREIAEPVLGLRLALSVVAAALLVAAAAVVAQTASDRNVLWLFALVLPAGALNLRWMILGAGGSRAAAVGNVLSQVVFVAGVLVLVRSKHDTLDVPVLQAAGLLGYALVVIWAARARYGLLRPRVNVVRWRATLRESLPLMVNGFARATVFSFDLLLIGVVLRRDDVGLYGVAVKPALFFSGLLGLFAVSFLASYSAASSGSTATLLRRTVLVSTGVTVPVAIVASVTAGLAVRLVFGDDYAAAATALAVLIWRAPLSALGLAYANVLTARDRQSVTMRNNVVAAIFNIAANCVAVPLAGIEGAAGVSVATEFLVFVLHHRSVVGRGLAPPLNVLLARR